MNTVEKLMNPPVGQWILVEQLGDRVWVDGEEVPLEILRELRGVNTERESDAQRPVGVLPEHGGY